jgi:hypothetical protein
MKKIFSIIAVSLCIALSACKTGQEVSTERPNSYGVSVTASSATKPDTLTAQRVDSLIYVDKLPTINKWVSSVYIDEETKCGYEFWTLYDRTTNIIYTLKLLPDNRFVMIKRTLKTR